MFDGRLLHYTEENLEDYEKSLQLVYIRKRPASVRGGGRQMPELKEETSGFAAEKKGKSALHNIAAPTEEGSSVTEVHSSSKQLNLQKIIFTPLVIFLQGVSYYCTPLMFC